MQYPDSTTPRTRPLAEEQGDSEPRYYTRMFSDLRDRNDLGVEARFTYWTLATYAVSSNIVYPGLDTLAAQLKTTRKTVRRWIDELVVAGLVKIVDHPRSARAHAYELLDLVPKTAPQPVPDMGKNYPYSDQIGVDTTHIKSEYGSKLPPKLIEDLKSIDHEEERDHARARAKLSKLDRADREATKSAARIAKTNAHMPKVLALCAAAGMDPGKLSATVRDRWIDAFANSTMPLEDVTPLANYLLGDPWYGMHRERLTAQALVSKWMGWDASGRPETAHAATQARTRGNGAEDVDAEMAVLRQQIADERGEVFEGVQPSYWPRPGQGVPSAARVGYDDREGSIVDAAWRTT